MEFLKKIYHKYSYTNFFRKLGEIYRNGFFLSNYMSYLRLKKITQKKSSTHEPIKVVFLCQYYQAWNKLKSVYERMRDDKRFETYIVAVPSDIKNISNEVYDYFSDLYGADVINAWQGDAWYDVTLLNPEYVFYQRPYDSYLPKVYRSNVVSKYAKICYVSYGYQIERATEGSCLNKLFYRNVYMYFAENSIYYNYNISRFKYSHKKGYRKTYDIGYPSLEDFVSQKDKCRTNNTMFKVLWTPRWSEDKEVGGSTFLKFKDLITELPRKMNNTVVVFRPHPMTFQHFVSVGKMSEKQVKDYMELYEKDERLKYDHKPNYAESFWDCSVLLTDVSSIIVEWFLTKKPIIYCETGCEPNEFLKEMMTVFYVVENWDEAEKKIGELRNGIDPLRELREQKVKELMGDDFEHISSRFLETIYQDYMS